MVRPSSVTTGLVVAVLAISALPHAASAGVEQFMNDGQGLSAGNAKASGSAHSGVDVVFGSADHTFCPAVAQGYGGYTSSPFTGGNFTAYQSWACGPRNQYWYPNGTANYYFHGAVYNPNSYTFDTFYWARYQW